jgi:hypothetical protein
MRVHVAVVAASLLAHISGVASAQANYVQFGNLNQSATNVTSTWSKLSTTTGSHTFAKSDNTSVLEVHVNSRFGVGTLSGGANGVRFQVRVDNATPTLENQGSLQTSNSSAFLSIFGVFRNIPAGTHIVSIWAQAAPSGSASSVVADPGGWGGKVIVKESR